MSRVRPTRRARRADRPPPALRDVLELAAGRTGTRLELICWQLNVDESVARPAWEEAVRHSLLEPHPAHPAAGQAMFTLSERGRRVLAELRPRRGQAR